MACKRSAVRSRLPPPKRKEVTKSPSSRGLGHRPFTAITRVRISLGTPNLVARCFYTLRQHRNKTNSPSGLFCLLQVTKSPSSRGLGHRPFTAITRVRISLGTPTSKSSQRCELFYLFSLFVPDESGHFLKRGLATQYHKVKSSNSYFKLRPNFYSSSTRTLSSI